MQFIARKIEIVISFLILWILPTLERVHYIIVQKFDVILFDVMFSLYDFFVVFRCNAY